MFFTRAHKNQRWRAKPVRMWSILFTTRSASSTVKHMGGLNLSTLRWGPSALSRMYCSLSLRWRSSWESIRTQLEWDGEVTNEIQTMHLLINDFLGLCCCRREFRPVLHKLHPNKQTTTPARSNVTLLIAQNRTWWGNPIVTHCASFTMSWVIVGRLRDKARWQALLW